MRREAFMANCIANLTPTPTKKHNYLKHWQSLSPCGLRRAGPDHHPAPEDVALARAQAALGSASSGNVSAF